MNSSEGDRLSTNDSTKTWGALQRGEYEKESIRVENWEQTEKSEKKIGNCFANNMFFSDFIS